MGAACRTKSTYTAITRPLAVSVAAMLVNNRRKVMVPNPLRHLSSLTIPAGPDFTNLVTPNAAVTNEQQKVTMKR